MTSEAIEEKPGIKLPPRNQGIWECLCNWQTTKPPPGVGEDKCLEEPRRPWDFTSMNSMVPAGSREWELRQNHKQLVRGEPRAKLHSPGEETQLTKLWRVTLCSPETLPSQGSPGPAFSNQNLRVYKETAQNGLRKERHQMAENIPEEN